MSVRLAKEMGLKIVAEGVETVEMWNFLQDLGIDEAQGYLMAKPMAPTRVPHPVGQWRAADTQGNPGVTTHTAEFRRFRGTTALFRTFLVR